MGNRFYFIAEREGIIMAYTLVKDLTTVNYTKGNSGRKYIVIHYTGNKTDTAKANANFFRSTNRGSSAHYFVDKTTVYQVVDDANTSWAVGKNYGSGNKFGTVTNKNSISIEMCSTNGVIADATFANTVALTKSLMAKYGISASNVYRHYDVCSKSCPGWTGWLGSSPTLWNKFKSQIGGASSTAGSTSTTTTSTNNLYKGYSSAQLNKMGQELLNEMYGTVDGLAKLTVDGEAGAATWKKLILNLQREMAVRGLYTGAIDGLFGSGSKKAHPSLSTSSKYNNTNIVKLYQIALMFCGYYPATTAKGKAACDMDYGTSVATATGLLQAAIGATPDKVFGSDSAYKLYHSRPGQ